MALKNFTQFTPQTVLSATDFVVGYRNVDEIRTDLDSLTVAISGLLIAKGFTPGGSVGTVKRINYRYTIDGGENLNAVSGMDDYGNYLSYTTGQLDVYRNGVHLVDNQDFIANNSTQILNLSTMNEGDVVDVVTLSATGVTITNLLSGGGTVFQTNYRYTCPTTVAQGTINITGPDDLGNTLLYSSPTLDVYLNGSHLVNGLDYSASNGSTITLSEGLSSGDVLDVATLSAYDIGGLGGVSRIVAGPGIILNPSSGLGEVTITGNTFELTGGNINIPVGSTRTYKNITGALNSLSSYAFDSTANVQILLDDETFISPNQIDVSHPYGNRITIKGANTYSWRSTNNGTNPIVSTSGVNVPTLSATITLDSTFSTIPAVGDYVTIESVSGRDVGWCSQMQDVSSYTITLQPSAAPVAVRSGAYHNIRTNDWALITKLSPFAAGPVTSAVIPITSIGPTPFGGIGWHSLSLSAQAFSLGNDARYIMVQVGTKDSNIGNKFTQALHPDGTRAILSFDNTAVSTNTYLNEGDFIHALGQFTHVYETSGTNRCIVFPPLYTNGAGNSGRSATISTATPYLVKTAFERYKGCHKVVAVAGNDVTIEMMSYGHITPTMAPNSTGVTIYPVSGQKLPIYGINNFGYNIDAVAPAGGFTQFATNKIFKSKIDFSTNTSSHQLAITNATLRLLDNMVFVRENATAALSLFLSNDGAEINLGSIGVWGNYIYAAICQNSSTINLGRFYATQVLRNYNSWTLASPTNAIFSQAIHFFVTCDSSSSMTSDSLVLRAFAPFVRGRASNNKTNYNNVTITDCITHNFQNVSFNGCTIYHAAQYVNGITGGFFSINFNTGMRHGTLFNKQYNNSYVGWYLGFDFVNMNIYLGNNRVDIGGTVGEGFFCAQSMMRLTLSMAQGDFSNYRFAQSILQIDSSVVLGGQAGGQANWFWGGTGGFGFRNNWVAFSETFINQIGNEQNANTGFGGNTIVAHVNKLYDTTAYASYQNTSVNLFAVLLLNCTTKVGPTVPAAGFDVTNGNFYREPATIL